MTRLIVVAFIIMLACAPVRASQTVAPKASSAPVAPNAVPPASTGTRVILPGGTPVTVVVSEKISSSTANVGDTFDIQASQDVIIDGWLVVKKGAPGQGEILAVDRAGSHGHPGSLGVQMDWIYSVDGHKVKLTSQRKTEEGEGKAGAASTATILSYVFLGPLGLFAHNFVKGHDVVVDNTHPLPAYIDDSVYVVANERGEGPDSNFAPTVADAATPAHPAPALVSPAHAPASMAPVAWPVAVAKPADAPVADQPRNTVMAPSQTAASTNTLMDFEGNQPKQTKSFSAPSQWSIQYTFDCSASPKDTPTGFSIMVTGATASVAPIIHAGSSGTDVVPISAGGTVTISVQSHCIWHVRALAAGTTAT